MDQNQNPADAPILTNAEKNLLLQIARETLESYLETGVTPRYEMPTTSSLLHQLPAFVTLKQKNGGLRGCIGRIIVSEPLIDTVQDCAISAATRDFSFSPVSGKTELSELVIEISVLSPFKRIRSAEEIEIGRHGLMLRQGMNSGLLLPQVASERNWERDEFLRAVCAKAGLPADTWRGRDAHLSVFSAEVFGEE